MRTLLNPITNLAGVALLTIFAASCEKPVQQNVNISSAPPANSQPAASPAQASDAPAPDTTANSGAVTMPLLGALLSDDDFAKDARNKVGLTDEEIDRLKNAAQQSTAGLSEDGDNGSRSTRTASSDATAQIDKIVGKEKGDKLIALVRERWGGGSPVTAKANSVPTDTRVVVNAPAYRLDIFQDGKLVKTYKVGIGYPEFPLPIAERKAEEIIVNPSWTPPDEPWVKGKVQAGKKIDAGSKLNPLGPIKIPIGYPSLIHGGKSPDRLGTFASHGCVGMTNGQIQDFALELAKLSNTDLSADSLKGLQKERDKTKNLKMGTPIPVEIRYDTIVVEDGTLHIYRDVYERGTNTEENLRNVLQAQGLSLDSLDQATRQQLLDGLKQMAVDAKGDPADPSESVSAKASNTSKKSEDNKSGKITRDVKGKKELTFKIPQLAGKGYPAPVNLSTK